MRMEAMTLSPLEDTKNTSIDEETSSTQDIIHLLQSKISQTKQIGIVVITFQFEDVRQKTRIIQSMQRLLESLRPLVRKSDTVLLLERSCYFLLDGANQQGARIVQERLWEALLWAVHNMNDELLRPRCMEAGHSVWPDDLAAPEECLDAARDPSIRFAAQRDETEQEADSRSASSLKTSELPLLARQLGIPYLSLLPRKLPGRVLRLIRPELAHELRCYPLGRERDMLTVAITDPQDQGIIERLQRETGLRIFPVLTQPEELQNALERLV